MHRMAGSKLGLARLALGLAAGLLAVARVDATILAEYTFAGASPASIDADSASTAGDFQLVAGTVETGTAYMTSNSTGSDEAGAVSGNDYA